MTNPIAFRARALAVRHRLKRVARRFDRAFEGGGRYHQCLAPVPSRLVQEWNKRQETSNPFRTSYKNTHYEMLVTGVRFGEGEMARIRPGKRIEPDVEQWPAVDGQHALGSDIRDGPQAAAFPRAEQERFYACALRTLMP
jgi:hypothetical protein